MKATENYNIPLYEPNDLANLCDGYNRGAEIMDSAMKANSDKVDTYDAAIQKNATDIATETTRANAAEKELATGVSNAVQAVASEKDRAEVAESKLAEDIIESDKNISMIAYATEGESSGVIALYVSRDSTNFTKIANIVDENGNSINADTKNVFCDDKDLYLICSGVLYKATENLLTFKLVGNVYPLFNPQNSFKNIWGVSGFFDSKTSKYYFYAGCGNSGGYNGDMQIYYFACDSIDMLPATATPQKITFDSFANVIDPYVTNYGDAYIMAFKDENRRECWVATSTNPYDFSVNKNIFSHAGRGFEGPQVIDINGNYTVWVDGYSIQAKDDAHIDPSTMYIPSMHFNGWFDLTNNALFNPISHTSLKLHSTATGLRHPAFACTNSIIKSLSKNITYNVIPYNKSKFVVATSKDNCIENDTYCLCNAPGLVRLLNPKNCTLNYEVVFNESTIFGIEYASESKKNLQFGKNFSAGNGYLTNSNRFITFVIGNEASAFPQVINYTAS